MANKLDSSKLIFCYDFKIAQRYISNGLIPFTIGVGKLGNPFLTFERGDELDKVNEVIGYKKKEV